MECSLSVVSRNEQKSQSQPNNIRFAPALFRKGLTLSARYGLPLRPTPNKDPT